MITAIILVFIGCFAIGSAFANGYFKSREISRINRKYVDVVDDSFRAINALLGKMEKSISALSFPIIQMDEKAIAMLPILPKAEPAPMKKELSDYIAHVKYCMDNFAETESEKMVLERVINNIKKQHGFKN